MLFFARHIYLKTASLLGKMTLILMSLRSERLNDESACEKAVGGTSAFYAGLVIASGMVANIGASVIV
ncbi:hypothetical protein S7335_1046 [Synechococcus sp. PCC 7335]|nr:hypothetical protein S7335_1046 [Synechococcus sp. PCC 7335]